MLQNSTLKELSRNEKDCSSVIQIDISARNEDDNTAVLVQAERNSNVTRRTKSRLTKVNDNTNSSVDKQRHTINVVSDDQIIHLDESSVSTRRTRNTRNTKSIAEISDLIETGKPTKTSSNNDVIFQVSTNSSDSAKRRTTRRISSQATTDTLQNNAKSRLAPKRKPDSIIPLHESGVSPPKQFPVANDSILEHSTNAVPSATNKEENVSGHFKVNVSAGIRRLLKSVQNSAFQSLIVSIKRIAPALSEGHLKQLKYPELDSTQDTTVPQHALIKATQLQGNVTEERRTLQRRKSTYEKPEIVITSPIIELPESPSPAPEGKSCQASKLVVPNSTKPQSSTFKKPNPVKLPPLPLLIEEENEDVYEFLSSSQNSNTSTSSKIARNPKQRKAKKPSGQLVKKKPKPLTTKPKPKAANPFGFDSKALQKVIKKIGGGPVKQPAKTGYKINFDIPKTPPIVAPIPPVPPTVHSLSDIELHCNDDPPPEVSRVFNPAMERLKPMRSQPLHTSTPAQKIGSVNSPSLASITCNAASPWRVQDEIIVPRTGYTHRTKEMLPSYDSFTTENNNVQIGSATSYVTERRKSPYAGTTVETVGEIPTDANLPEASSDAVISDKDLREFEQMNKELTVMSEMSKKLIAAMRRCKANGAKPQHDPNMRQACQKLKKWYDRSMQAFNHSMRIMGSIERMNNDVTGRSTACPSPMLTQEQQQTVESFNLSTGRFRSMIDDLKLAMNDSDIENRPPPPPSSNKGAKVATVPERKSPNGLAKYPKDVVILPERGTAANRNPLMPLNVVPLPQHDSPLMSPLAKQLPASPEQATTSPGNILRRKLQYDKENNESVIINEKQQTGNDVAQTKAHAPSVGSVVEIFDETTDNGSAHHDNRDAHNSNEHASDAVNFTQDYFGFNDGDSVVESSVAQVTLPMPLNISNETLQHRLQNVKQLLPKRPIFRRQPKQLQSRSSGPTRFPTKNLRVFSSPTKRPHTLRDFVASTPRPGGSATEQSAEPSTGLRPFAIEAPDVSAIEPNCENAEKTVEPEVVLFDTPDRPAWLNNSAHQRTYARVPKLRKKKNIYLANLGLVDDDDDDDEEEDPDVMHDLISDSEADEAKRIKKNKQRKAKRKPVPVEQVILNQLKKTCTKDFKEFVDNFNSMCEEVERYEMIVE
uniref:Uncharacterized protein n=1 Tax=Anopheles christyi TaxID=43041 RepID=A0A182JQK5_9DIPT